MPKGYAIFTEAIHDPEGMRAYMRAAGPTLASGEAKVLAADSSPATLEGEWHGNQTVILEFASVDAARAWYESPAYKAAAALRQASAHCNAAIISGF